jgi:putative hydrolase of the HAD superfamily
MYKAVFLDIGGVILHIDWRRPFEFCGIFDPRRQKELIAKFHGSPLFHRFERGQMSSTDFLMGLGELMELDLPPERLEQAWQSLILGELPGLNALFDRVEGKYPVYALSNTNVLHASYMIKNFPILHRFKKVITSCDIGERKPDVAFYLKACEICGVEPDEVVFVDDTFENVEAARRVGILSAQTVNSVQETTEFLRANLAQLAD